MTSKVSVMVSRVRSGTWKILDISVGLLLTVIFCPILFCAWLLNELIRILIVSPLLRICTGGRIKLVPDGADNVFTFRKPGNSRNILVLTVYKELIDPERYRENFMSRVINYVGRDGKKPFRKLRTIPTNKFGYNCWRTADNFDIRDHVVVWSESSEIVRQKCAESDNQEVVTEIPVFTESNVMRMMDQLKEDMDPGKPQWQEILIPNFLYEHEVESSVIIEEDGKGSNVKRTVLSLKESAKFRTARIFRCHHGYMDGASVLLITSKCMTDGEFPYSADPLAPMRMSGWDRLSLIFRSVAFGIKTVLKTIVVAATAKNRFVTRKFHGKCHHVWSAPIRLSTVMEIKHTAKSPFPALLAALTAGAIKKLDEQYPAVAKKLSSGCFANEAKSGGGGGDEEDPATIQKHAPVPEKVLIGMIGAVGPYPDVAPRNRYTVVNFNAPTTHMSRLERLEKMNEKIRKLAQGEEFLVNLWLFQIFGRFPAFVVQAMMTNAGSPVVVSNTPWAKSRVKLMGDEVEELGGWVPLLAFSGVGFLITRYCDTLRFCAVAEDACLSEEQLRFLISEIQSEVELLHQECLALKKTSATLMIQV